MGVVCRQLRKRLLLWDAVPGAPRQGWGQKIGKTLRLNARRATPRYVIVPRAGRLVPEVTEPPASQQWIVESDQLQPVGEQGACWVCSWR